MSRLEDWRVADEVVCALDPALASRVNSIGSGLGIEVVDEFLDRVDRGVEALRAARAVLNECIIE